jgi:hypothetical protein
VFARERGLLQLSPATRLRLNVSSVTFTLHSDDACLLQSLDDFSVSSHSQSYLLGSYFNSWIQRAHPTVLTYLAGYDNVIANALHYRFVTGQMPELWLVDDDAVGYGVLLNLDTNEQRRLRKSNHVPLIAFMTRSWFVNASSTIPIGALISLIVFKADMIMSALLLVGSLTNMIGWILRESQSRMVQFTVDLQRSVQENQSVSRLVVSHLVACSAFIPFVIGIFMFMFAVFDNDHTIAFFFMVCMWLTEAFAMIYVRTLPSTTFYGGFAATYFFIFYGFVILSLNSAFCVHIMSEFFVPFRYFFTYPLGFHRLALWTCALLLLHGSVFFLMRFELPAAEILMTEELDNRDD